jgi:3-hydroxy-3-methylglutaryl CoA synthase
VRWGAYIPPTRLPLSLIAGRTPKDGEAEKAVAAFDEDSITMAVAAAVDCLNGVERDTIDGLYFASTTAPYAEKLAAALIAKALDLPRCVRSADFSGSLRAGTTALLAACDAVAAGSLDRVLVVASDTRMAPPRSAMERNFGDGAAAFLIGRDALAAQLDASLCSTNEMLDVWRAGDDRFVRSWEERFVTQHGYGDVVRETSERFFDACGAAPTDFSRVAMYAPDARSLMQASRSLGFAPTCLQDALFGRVGNCGAAFAPLLLAAALENALPNERVLSISYGDGADVVAFTAGDDPGSGRGRDGVHGHLARRRALRSYDAYLAGRRLIETGADARAGGGIAATVHWRERDQDISLRAERCRRCGTHHFPAQRVCYRCSTKDDFEPVRMSDKPGRLMSFTFDYFFPTPEPPLVAGMVEIEGGCRIYLQMTDAEPKQVRCDLPVELVFRKIHEAGAKPNYFWKCRPLEDDATRTGEA